MTTIQRMIKIAEFAERFPECFPSLQSLTPWLFTRELLSIIEQTIPTLPTEFKIQNNIAIHESAIVEHGVILKPPIVVGPNCFIGSNAYFRGGCYMDESVTIGPGCEIKSSVILAKSSIAHFNFIGDSIIGSYVNFEAGAVIANHYNERIDKEISILYQDTNFKTGFKKFGALVGDQCKIGANAVLSPGTILIPNTIVGRLELIEQIKA